LNHKGFMKNTSLSTSPFSNRKTISECKNLMHFANFSARHLCGFVCARRREQINVDLLPGAPRAHFQIAWQQQSKVRHNKGECAIRSLSRALPETLRVHNYSYSSQLCGVGGTDLCIKARTLTARNAIS
jgi:uncharacterized protein (DUF2236 family)